tara:strand:+ start:367 stop:1047 length:681 start_codon:yes stop_codon:yes gene_type:complete
MEILTVDNPKFNKNLALRYLTAGLTFSPADSSGRSVCPPKTCTFCKDECLNSAGRGIFQNVQDARIRRTNLFFDKPKEFWHLIQKDIDTALNNRKGLKVCIRMNVLSDLPWERIKVHGTKKSIMELYPHVQFYDYTKVPKRVVPDNYHLTFSLSADNDREAMEEVYEYGRNLSVVTWKRPRKFYGITTVDGDKHDLTFLRPYPRVLALKPKGAMKNNTNGFVRGKR